MGVFSEKNICDMIMGVFSEEENPWNGGQFEGDFQAWEYLIVGSGLPGTFPQSEPGFLTLFSPT